MIELENLREIAAGDEEFIMGVLALFISKEEEYAQVLIGAMDNGDLDELRQIVHKIKSSVSVIGMNDFRKKLDRFEKKLMTGTISLEEARQEGSQILSDFRDAEHEVKVLLGQMQSNV